MYFIIDDERTLGCELIARTAKVGKLILSELSNRIECLCIDHDLGTLETGYDVINWAVENDCLPKHVQVVSMNPVGKENIARALVAAGYRSRDNINFKKVDLNEHLHFE